MQQTDLRTPTMGELKRRYNRRYAGGSTVCVEFN